MYQSAMTNSSVNRATSQVTAVISAVRQLYPNGNYAGLDATAIRNSLPQEMRGGPGGAALVNAFGTPITLFPAGSNGFSVMFDNIQNREACSRLASLDFGGSVIQTYVDNVQVLMSGALDRTAIDQACSSGSPTDISSHILQVSR